MDMTMNSIITSVVIASASMLITASPAFAITSSSSSPSRDDVPSGTAVDGIYDCEYEDGNVNGLPCVWTSPSTGKLYYNDSATYR